MNENVHKAFLDSINSMPPILRYPALLAIAEVVAKELPKAEALYHEEQWRILEDFNKFTRERVEKVDDE